MKIKKVALPEKCRIICVSDIHGHADDFERLLKKCEYDADNDFLFILGDILEKGNQNIKMIHLEDDSSCKKTVPQRKDCLYPG